MNALVYNGPEDLSLTQVNDLIPGRDEVLIKVKATGICGSDVHGYLGITGRRIPPMIMGHEFSGDISELGAGVKDFSVGERVTVQPLIFCSRCKYCKQGLTHLCQNKKMYGVMDVNGSMAEYICVQEKLVYRLPGSVSYLYGAMLEPLAVAYSAVKRAQGIEGKNVLVVGAGTIGLMVLQVVKSQNPARIFVVDINQFRLDLAKKMGADFTFNPNDNKAKEIISRETETKGVDIAFEAVGISSTVQHAISALARRGRCIWIGISEKMITMDMQEVVTREIDISGTYAYTHVEFGEAINLIVSQNLNLNPMISKSVPLAEGPEILRQLAKGGEMIKVVLTD